MSRTAVWISRDEMVDFLEYAASSGKNKTSLLSPSHHDETSTRTGSLGGDSFKDVIDKRVEDGHGLVGDTRVRMHLLENCTRHGDQRRVSGIGPSGGLTLVNVRRVRLLSQLLSLLLFALDGRGGL